MVYKFLPSALISVFSYAVAVGSFVLVFMDMLPLIYGLLLVVIAFVLQIGSMKTAQICYIRSLRRAEKDLEGFLKFQDRLAARSSVRIRAMVSMNTVIALIHHEKTDEARKRLIAFGNTLGTADLMTRFNYLSILALIELCERKFESMDHYIAQMGELIAYLRSALDETAGTAVKKCEMVIDTLQTDAEFLSRTPVQLAGDDRVYAEKYLESMEKAEKVTSTESGFRNFNKFKLAYNKGLVYAVFGDVEQAKTLMKSVSECGMTYPFVERAKLYLESGDVEKIWRY